MQQKYVVYYKLIAGSRKHTVAAFMTFETMFAAPNMHSKPYLDGPRLLADIGGTNVRFALERAPGQIDTIRALPYASHAVTPQ